MKPEGSLQHLQQPATCSYPESGRAGPCASSHFSKIHFNIILPSTNVFQEDLLPQVTLLTLCMHFYFPPVRATCLTISVFLTWSNGWHLVRNSEHKAPSYVAFWF
jgi:hypothetical protein